jgi:ABC-2 type transport system ATP-binding protein
MIRLEALTKRYGKLEAVKGIDLEVRPAEVFGFLGPNGAGKTTTLRMLTGLLRPTSGRIIVAGIDLAEDPLAVKSIMGFIPDRPYIYEKLTAVEFLRFVAGLYRVPTATTDRRIPKLLAQFHLVGRGDSLVESYSHGMRQRLVMCASLLHEPQLLVVDEPMVGLDPAGARLLKEIFRTLCHDEERTVFLSTHSMDVAEEVCDRIAIIHHGKIIALGTVEELRDKAGQSAARLEEVFLQLTQEDERTVSQPEVEPLGA